MVGLQVREAHLDALALIPRFEERLGLHLASRHLAGIFVDVARHIARLILRAALRSQRTAIAVALAGAVALSAIAVHGSAGPELLAVRADVDARRWSHRKSEAGKMPSSRLDRSQTGMCGVILFSLPSQPRNLPVP